MNDINRRLQESGIRAHEHETEAPELSHGEQRVLRTAKTGARIIEMANTPEDVELSSHERAAAAGMLRRELWGDVVRELKDGGKLATFGTTEGLRLKQLNHLLGEQETDAFIGFRNIVLRELMGYDFSNIDTKDIEKTFEVLISDSVEDENIRKHIQERFGASLEAKSTKVLSQDAKRTRVSIGETSLDKLSKVAEISSFLSRSRLQVMLRERLAETSHTPSSGSLREEIQRELDFLDDAESYKISFGVADVIKSDNSSDISHVTSAIARSEQALRVVASQEEVEYVGAYEKERVMGGFQAAKDFAERGLKASLMITGTKTTRDSVKKTVTYKVFEEGSDGNIYLNPSVIDRIRKGDFTPEGATDEAAVKEIESYLSNVNLLDIIKPMTAEEAAGELNMGNGVSYHEHFTHLESLAQRIESGESDTELIREIGEVLSKDNRDFASDRLDVFHAGALSLDHAAYLSLDIIGLGGAQTRIYEEYYQKVLREEMTLEDASQQASDVMTKQLRKFREIAIAATQNKFPDRRVFSHAGGDELKLAFDMDGLEQSDIDEITYLIQAAIKSSSELSARITSVAIGSSERQSSAADTTNQKVKDHFDAYKGAEEAHEESKFLEGRVGEIRSQIDLHDTKLNDISHIDIIRNMIDQTDWPPPVIIIDNKRFVSYYKSQTEVLHIPAKEFISSIVSILNA